MDYSSMQMEIQLPESALPYIKTEQRVHVTHYTLERDTLRGKITQLSPAIDSQTRTFQGVITISNPSLKLRPGMFTKAEIVVDAAHKAIIISKSALLYRNRRPYVYIVQKNTAIQRWIATGLENDDKVQVRRGLKRGENLIIKGFETLKPNSKVKVIQ